MDIPTLATNFHIPFRRAGPVARHRLLEQLDTGLCKHHKLTLISAPAGYGKTTLVVEWIANLQASITNRKPKVSWLSLDEADNDPARFLRYFLVAFIETFRGSHRDVLDYLAGEVLLLFRHRPG